MRCQNKFRRPSFISRCEKHAHAMESAVSTAVSIAISSVVVVLTRRRRNPKLGGWGSPRAQSEPGQGLSNERHGQRGPDASVSPCEALRRFDEARAMQRGDEMYAAQLDATGDADAMQAGISASLQQTRTATATGHANHANRAMSTEPSPDLTLVDVAGDGSCLLRAIFKSAKKLDALDAVARCFPIEGSRDAADTGSELEFARTMRDALARRGSQPGNGKFRATFRRLKELSSGDYLHHRKELPSYVVKAFEVAIQNDTNREEEVFVEQCVGSVLTMNVWLGEVECWMIKEMLREGNAPVDFIVHNANDMEGAKKLTAKFRSDGTYPPNTMLLVNVGTIHYMFIAPDANGIEPEWVIHVD